MRILEVSKRFNRLASIDTIWRNIAVGELSWPKNVYKSTYCSLPAPPVININPPIESWKEFCRFLLTPCRTYLLTNQLHGRKYVQSIIDPYYEIEVKSSELGNGKVDLCDKEPLYKSLFHQKRLLEFKEELVIEPLIEFSYMETNESDLEVYELMLINDDDHSFTEVVDSCRKVRGDLSYSEIIKKVWRTHALGESPIFESTSKEDCLRKEKILLEESLNCRVRKKPVDMMSLVTELFQASRSINERDIATSNKTEIPKSGNLEIKIYRESSIFDEQHLNTVMEIVTNIIPQIDERIVSMQYALFGFSTLIVGERNEMLKIFEKLKSNETIAGSIILRAAKEKNVMLELDDDSDDSDDSDEEEDDDLIFEPTTGIDENV